MAVFVTYISLSTRYLSWCLDYFSISGAADEASVVFGEAAALCMQKQYLHHGSASQNMQESNEDRNLVSARNFGLDDVSPRQVKLMQGTSVRDIPGNYHSATVSGGASSQPPSGTSNVSFYNTPSPMGTQVP